MNPSFSDLESRFEELLKKPYKNKDEVLELENLIASLEEMLRQEYWDLLKEIYEKGIIINDIWDLVHTKESYPEIIEILINHLSKKYHEKNLEGIVRALCVKEAKGKATKPLITLFINTETDLIYLRWAIINTLRRVITTDQFELIIPLIQNNEFKVFREDLMKILKKSKKGRTILSELHWTENP
jgi:hypothetical protein